MCYSTVAGLNDMVWAREDRETNEKINLPGIIEIRNPLLKTWGSIGKYPTFKILAHILKKKNLISVY